MKEFHISDILSITTGRLVSTRGMQGIYDILNYLTGDNLFTHQLPRASEECEPYLKRNYPKLFPDYPAMKSLLRDLDDSIDSCDGSREELVERVDRWVGLVMKVLKLPEYMGLLPLSKGEHEDKDPVDELEEMIGRHRLVIVERN